MSELTSVAGLIALGAAAVAVLALGLGIVLALRLRRLRAAQAVVLGDEERDLVTHAERLQTGFVELRDWVEEALGRLDERMSGDEDRLRGVLTYRSLVRYDAYEEMSGRQSSSLALLDGYRSGVVLTSILQRDQARFYVKQLVEGEPEHELSPEEQEAVDAALESGPVAAV
jgi:hypothetical protein